MAQPIYFAPGYLAPSRVKLEEQMLKQQALETGFQNIAGALQSYVDTKTKQKTDKLTLMSGMAATYGGGALGSEFQDEYGRLLHTYGIDLKKDESGKYTIPESFESTLRAHIMKHPEMLPAILGVQKPELSLGEQRHNDEIAALRQAMNDERAHATELKYDAEIKKLEEQLQSTRELIAGRRDVAGITSAASITRTQIQADAKMHGDSLADATKRLNITMTDAVRRYGIDKKAVSAAYGVDMKSLDAELNRESKERTAAAQVAEQDKKRQDAVDRFNALPSQQPSGFYNVGGKVVEGGKVNANPEQYPGAYPLNYGMLAMQTKYESLRSLDQDRSQKFQMAMKKLEKDANDKELRGLMVEVGNAIRGKDPKKIQFAWSTLLTKQNELEGLGMDEDDIKKITENPGAFQAVRDFFHSLSSEPTPPADAGTRPSTTTTTTGPPGTTTTTLPSKEPQKAPSVGGAGVVHMDDGTDVQFFPLTQ